MEIISVDCKTTSGKVFLTTFISCALKHLLVYFMVYLLAHVMTRDSQINAAFTEINGKNGKLQSRKAEWGLPTLFRLN